MKQCPYCGEIIDDNSQICEVCGESLSQITLSQMEPDVVMQKLNKATEKCMAICDVAQVISADFRSIQQAKAEMEYQISLLDHQLDAFKAQMGTDLEKYKIKAAMLEKQLDDISKKIDKMIDKILSIDTSDLNPSKIQQQTMLIEMLQGFNNNFNNILFKLM